MSGLSERTSVCKGDQSQLVERHKMDATNAGGIVDVMGHEMLWKMQAVNNALLK